MPKLATGSAIRTARIDMPPRDLTRRYIRLANELGNEMGKARGWRRRVAERLGIDESTLSRILKGERAVGWELAERAIERVKLDPTYFATPDGSKKAAKRSTSGKGEAELTELVHRIEAGKAVHSDVYELARAILDGPAVQRADAILKTNRPKSEQEIGALFLEASRLIEELRRQAEAIVAK